MLGESHAGRRSFFFLGLKLLSTLHLWSHPKSVILSQVVKIKLLVIHNKYGQRNTSETFKVHNIITSLFYVFVTYRNAGNVSIFKHLKGSHI